MKEGRWVDIIGGDRIVAVVRRRGDATREQVEARLAKHYAIANLRLRAVRAYFEFLGRGWSPNEAAREVRRDGRLCGCGLGRTALDRYRAAYDQAIAAGQDPVEALMPRTSRCGRRSVVEKLRGCITPTMIDRVRQRVAAGVSRSAAWRAEAEDLDCPAALADILRAGRNIPGVLLKLADCGPWLLEQVRPVDVDLVRRLALAVGSEWRAWAVFAELPECPAPVASAVGRGRVPGALLAAARVCQAGGVKRSGRWILLAAPSADEGGKE